MVKTADILTLPDSANTHDHSHHQLVLGLEGDTAFELGRGGLSWQQSVP